MTAHEAIIEADQQLRHSGKPNGEDCSSLDLKPAQDRIAGFAAARGVMAPDPLTDPDGSPSAALKAFCKAQNVTLDWALLGEGPVKHGRRAKPMADLLFDAVYLHGILQGIDHLLFDMPGEASALSNSLTAISNEAVAKADRLHREMDNYNEAQEAMRGRHGKVSKLNDRWCDANKKWRAAIASLHTDAAEIPEMAALSEKADAAAAELVRAEPCSIAECVLLIDWVLQDGEGDILDPKHTVAQKNVLAFLQGYACS